MARRARRRASHENHERWLITYADLITLLLVFFVIMYAMSKVDQAKFETLAKALNLQFQKADSIIEGGSAIITLADTGKGEEGENRQGNNDDAEEQQPMTEEEPLNDQEKLQQEQELQELVNKVQQYIEENGLQQAVSVSDTPKGVAITLNDLFLFNLGKADLKQPAYPILEKLASLFPALSTTVSIEGHTDNNPISPSSPFRDNWELSYERSMSVLRYFLYTAQLSGDMFVAQAHGDTRPVAPNDTTANQQKNRRVEIIVLREAPIPARP